ncbi:MAG: thiaminase II [Egibacteraceae bacterium]
MELTGQLWSSITPIYDRILAHPFVQGLTDGSLDRDSFRFYVVQDAHYLRDYARALSLCAARAPRDDDIVMFSRHATGAIEVERQLHEGFFAELGLSEDDVAATPVAPTCLAYTSYLLAVCHGGSFAEAVAAVLPCYWIYWEVGKALLERGSPDPLYQRWIDTYGGEEFSAIVRDVLAVTDRLGDEVDAVERARMAAHFVTTTRYEWMFWDAGWRQEQWPV